MPLPFRLGGLLALLLIAAGCQRHAHPLSVDPSYLTLDAGAGDSSIVALIAPYKVQLDAQMAEVLNHVDSLLSKAQPEGSLGNWMSDAALGGLRAAGHEADFFVINAGSIRVPSLQPGPLTRGEVFELMPFDNQIVVLEADSAVVARLMAHLCALGGWPLSEGVRCTCGPQPQVRIGGEALRGGRVYRIGISDYVANGGDRAEFLKNVPRAETQVLLRDAIILFAQQSPGNIRPPAAGRLRYAAE